MHGKVVGASAASCTTMARHSRGLGLDYSDGKINEVAYEGEKGTRGTPSGIDNTLDLRRLDLDYNKREGSSQLMEQMRIRRPVRIQ